jgi:hypothetical protein
MKNIWDASRKDFWMIFFTNLISIIVVMFMMLLLVIPGIYFAIVIMLVPIIRIQERTGYFKSLGRSMRLLSGRWWFTFWLLFILSMIVGIMGMILAMPTSGIYFLALMHKADLNSIFYKNLFILAGIIQSFTSFLGVIIYFAMSIHYFSLVERKEGTGLMKKVEEIDGPAGK